MATFAKLGFVVDSSQVIAAKRDLGQLNAETTKVVKSTDALSGQYKSLRSSIDPAFAAQQQYNASLRVLQQELREGRIGYQQFRKDLASIEAATIGVTKGGFRPMGNAMQMVGYQVGDFAVQVGAGQNALVAFGQQASQLAGIFGGGGALLGAVIAVGSALGGAYMRGASGASDATETLLDRVKALDLEYKELTSSMKAALAIDLAKKEDERAEKVAKLNEELQKQLDIQKQFDAQEGGLRGEVRTPMQQGQVYDLQQQQLGFVTTEDVEASTLKIAQLRFELEVLAAEERKARDDMDNLVYGLDEAGDAAGEAADTVSTLVLSLQEQAAAIGETARETDLRIAIANKADKADIKAINTAYDAIEAEEERQKAADERAKTDQKNAQEAARIAAANERYAQSIMDAIDPMAAFGREAQKMWDAFMRGDLGDITENQLQAYIDKLREAAQAASEIGTNWGDSFSKVANSLGAATGELAKVQGAMAEGSKEAQTLADVMNVLAVAQGIAAVASQLAGGDVYSAIPRALAVAAMLASMGVNTGAGTGGAASAASDAQATQGTGTVFGDSSARSESINNAVEITADATSKLPGLAQAQLEALRAMQAGIGSAASLILRGGNNLPGAGESMGFEELSARGASRLTGGLINDEWLQAIVNPLEALFGLDIHFLDDIMGSSSDVINEGIAIAGGRINDLINNTLASAFQEVEEKKHFLDDKDVRRFEEALGDDVGQQFSMVFGSMVDAVTAAAEVLGYADNQIQTRINRFRIAATEISLMDLTGEEQQAALEAVFSQIFDNLASAVVPYIDEFAMVGEGMAETLVRVATQIQVADEYMGQLGNTLLDGLGGRELAQMSDDLIQAAGGLENFMSVMGNFVNTFATDEHKLLVATNSINSAFEQMGLQVPETRDGVWALMQTLTDPAQIARLAGLTDALDTYYDAIDQQAQAAAQAANAELELARARVQSAELTTNEALQRLRESVSAQRDIATQAYNTAVEAEEARAQGLIDAANAAFESQTAGIESWADRTRSAMNDLLQITSALEGAVRANVLQTAAMEQAQRQGAQAVIARALSTGNLSGVESAAGVLSRGPNAAAFGSQFEMAFDAARTANQLQALADRTGSQASVQQQTLSALERQLTQAQANHAENIAAIESDSQGILSALEAGYNSELERLDTIVMDAEEQVNLLRGIDAALYSVEDSLRNLDVSMNDERQARMELALIESKNANKELVAEVKQLRAEWQRVKERELEEMEDNTQQLEDIVRNTA